MFPNLFLVCSTPTYLCRYLVTPQDDQIGIKIIFFVLTEGTLATSSRHPGWESLTKITGTVGSKGLIFNKPFRMGVFLFFSLFTFLISQRVRLQCSAIYCFLPLCTRLVYFYHIQFLPKQFLPEFESVDLESHQS